MSPRITSRMVLSVCALFAAPLPLVQAQNAPPGEAYRKVYAGDLISGYLDEGVRVEAEGHIGHHRGVIEFKTDPISARAPLIIEAASLPREIAERIARECDMEGKAFGGCSVTARGIVPAKGSRRFAPHELVIEGPYKRPGGR